MPLPAQVRRRFLPEPGLDDPPVTSPCDAMHLPRTQQASSYLFRLAAKQEFFVLCSLFIPKGPQVCYRSISFFWINPVTFEP